MDIVDMYEFYLKLNPGFNPNEEYFDYCDHDDFISYGNHLDMQFDPRDYENPNGERYISSDLNIICFLLVNYLNELIELESINIAIDVNDDRIYFAPFKEKDKYAIFILPSVKENINHIKSVFLSLKQSNTERYDKIALHIDVSSEMDMLVFSILHEVGHCVHIAKSNLSLREYFLVHDYCKFSNASERICNKCSEEKKLQNCNYYCEISADEFAFKHIYQVKQMILKAINKSKSIEK